MYIQPTDKRGGELPFAVPRNYSGNAFRAPMAEPEAELTEESAGELTTEEQAPPEELPAEPGSEQSIEQAEPGEAVAASADFREKSPPFGGILSRIPFLSSFLPPPRGGAMRRRSGEGLPEWVVIAAVILLLAGDEGGGDILPFLLLLLLWD